MKKEKTRKKMEIEDLAAMVKRGLDDVKEDIKNYVRETVHDSEHKTIREIEDLKFKLSAYISTWDRDFDMMNDRVIQHEKRINTLEDELVK